MVYNVPINCHLNGIHQLKGRRASYDFLFFGLSALMSSKLCTLMLTLTLAPHLVNAGARISFREDKHTFSCTLPLCKMCLRGTHLDEDMFIYQHSGHPSHSSTCAMFQSLSLVLWLCTQQHSPLTPCQRHINSRWKMLLVLSVRSRR